MPGSHAEIEDDRLIRELLQNWAIWRDAGDWERFRTVWHDDGRMMATWLQGTGRRVHRSQPSRLGPRASASCISSAASRSTSRDTRAIAQTKMTISQRAEVDGVLCDVRLHRAVLRFLREARRALGHRAAPADLREGPHGPGRRPAQRPSLDTALLEQFPPRLPAPRLPADPHRLHGEARHARPEGARSRGAVRARCGIGCRASRLADLLAHGRGGVAHRLQFSERDVARHVFHAAVGRDDQPVRRRRASGRCGCDRPPRRRSRSRDCRGRARRA